MLKSVLSTCLLLCSVNSYADEISDSSFYYSGSLLGGVAPSKDTSWTRYNLGVGYQFHSRYSAGLQIGFSDYSNTSKTSLFGYARATYPIGETSKFHADIGLNSDDLAPFGQIGVMFEMSPNTYLGVSNHIEMHQDDTIYGLSIGLTYSIPRPQQVVSTQPALVDDIPRAEVDIFHCLVNSEILHHVTYGEDVNSIASQYSVTLRDLYRANANLEQQIANQQSITIPVIRARPCLIK